MGAETMLATPAPGTLGARQAARVDMDVADVDVDHLLTEHRALAARYKTDLRDALDVITELTELVCEAFEMLVTGCDDEPADWFDRAAPIAGEAT
jgi:hypothetical protein